MPNTIQKTLHVLGLIPLLLLTLLCGLLYFILIFPYSLAYTFYFYSPNIRMRRPDMPPVQLYLDHFNTLHPDLLASVFRAVSQRPTGGRVKGLEFWPNLSAGVPQVEEYQSPPGSILFAGLERVGWERGVVWEFLRGQVEGKGMVGVEERRGFGRVMGKMCSHRMEAHLEGITEFLTGWTDRFDKGGKEEGEGVQMLGSTGGGRRQEQGMKIVEAKIDRLDWVLEQGGVVVPDSAHVEECVKLLRALRGEFPATWGWMDAALPLEEQFSRYWQVIDVPPEPPEESSDV